MLIDNRRDLLDNRLDTSAYLAGEHQVYTRSFRHLTFLYTVQVASPHLQAPRRRPLLPTFQQDLKSAYSNTHLIIASDKFRKNGGRQGDRACPMDATHADAPGWRNDTGEAKVTHAEGTV